MHEQSVSLLNEAIAEKLSAFQQYLYCHFHCQDMGNELLSALFRQTAIEEMLHIERLAQRVLFLRGEVQLAPAVDVKKVRDLEKMLQLARKMEQEAALRCNQRAKDCGANADAVSRRLFEELVVDEERHLDQYDTELRSIDRFGEKYLVLHSIERSKRRVAGATESASVRQPGQIPQLPIQPKLRQTPFFE